MESVMCECLLASGRALVTATMVWSAKNRACKRVPDSPHPPLLKRLFWPLSKGFCPITMPTCLMEWGTSGQRGGEYLNSEMDKFCEDICIRRNITVPYNPQQNPYAERTWGTLLRKVRTCMAESDIPAKFWPYAIQQAALIHNVVVDENGVSPYHIYCMVSTSTIPSFTFSDACATICFQTEIVKANCLQQHCQQFIWAPTKTGMDTMYMCLTCSEPQQHTMLCSASIDFTPVSKRTECVSTRRLTGISNQLDVLVVKHRATC